MQEVKGTLETENAVVVESSKEVLMLQETPLRENTYGPEWSVRRIVPYTCIPWLFVSVICSIVAEIYSETKIIILGVHLISAVHTAAVVFETLYFYSLVVWAKNRRCPDVPERVSNVAKNDFINQTAFMVGTLVVRFGANVVENSCALHFSANCHMISSHLANANFITSCAMAFAFMMNMYVFWKIYSDSKSDFLNRKQN